MGTMPKEEIYQYLPVLIQAAVVVCVPVGMLITSYILGQVGKRTEAKDIPYECGKNPEGEGVPRFSVKFYIVAMIFILFDIEVIFMYPWAVNFLDFVSSGFGAPVFWSMLAFVLIVEVGHLYAYKEGVFDWSRRSTGRA